MVRVEPTNSRTAGIDTNHSTMFTLLLELNVMQYVNKGRYSSNCKILPAEFLHFMAKYTLPFGKPVKSDHN